MVGVDDDEGHRWLRVLFFLKIGRSEAHLVEMGADAKRRKEETKAREKADADLKEVCVCMCAYARMHACYTTAFRLNSKCP